MKIFIRLRLLVGIFESKKRQKPDSSEKRSKHVDS